MPHEILQLCGPESSRPDHQTGVSFTNVEVQLVPGIDSRVYPQVACFGCHKKDHRFFQCPEAAAAGAVVKSAGAEGKEVNFCLVNKRRVSHSCKSSRRLASHSKELDTVE